MQYCIRSLISITNVQKYCKRAKVRASLLLWHFQTIWIENICLPFIEVHRSNQQKLFHFAHRGFSYFLISTQNFNEWRPNVGINILVLTNAQKECGVRKYGSLCWLKNIQYNISIFWWSHPWFWRVAQSFRFCRHELPSCHVFSWLVVSKYTVSYWRRSHPRPSNQVTKKSPSQARSVTTYQHSVWGFSHRV